MYVCNNHLSKLLVLVPEHFLKKKHEGTKVVFLARKQIYLIVIITFLVEFYLGIVVLVTNEWYILQEYLLLER